MKAVTGRQMGQIDKYSIETLGIPGIVLVENAALKLVRHVQLYFEQRPHLSKDAVIIAGKGNNAGDAFAAARHLIVQKINVRVYCLFDEISLSGDAKANFEILKKIDAEICFMHSDESWDELVSDLKNAQLVLDGIFGTGFRGEITGSAAAVISLVNQYSRYTISIDIASGIESSTGHAAQPCIRAHKTVTFELPKIGQLIHPGLEFTGELAVESIGMPKKALESVENTIYLTDAEMVKQYIPKRYANSNKGSFGKVALAAGSTGMAGAGCISAKAALHSGSGLVYLAGPSKIMNIFQSVVPEAVAIRLDGEEDNLCAQDVDKISQLMNKCDVAAIGPGLSCNPTVYNVIEGIAKNIQSPVVLDADGLNAAAMDIKIFNYFKGEVVITPHPGEMARLTGLEISYIQHNRIEVARKYAMQWGITVLLKGAGTIIADKNGRVFINPTGNSGMATAGSGDALTGIIASFIGQGAGVLEAAVTGAYIHGLAGDLAAKEKGQYGMTVWDIINYIPCAIKNSI